MKEQIAEAQRQILFNLSRWELVLAELYGKYAQQVPEMSAFWNKIAQEEQCHAAMLNSLLKKIDEGHLFFNVGAYEWDEIEKEIKVILLALNEANTGAITAETALKTAVKMESLMMESRFYDDAVSDDPAFKHIAAALRKATHDHFFRLQERFTAMSGG